MLSSADPSKPLTAKGINADYNNTAANALERYRSNNVNSQSATVVPIIDGGKI